ncbi:MAG: 1-acyl-sn-glycerol-3-phosphate acyltransferase [Clostridia bacterium]|nr:1-acyl-sn-glycerol-3-phosphate acyltransferase [Clostridia bacterium]
MAKKVKFDYSVIKERKLYDFLRPLGRLICKLFFKVKYVGTENLPENGGFILASNHIHALDPLIIALGLKKRQMHFMAKKELWENPFIAFCLSTVGGFPVARGSADRTALGYADRIPAEGYVLGIFPEGTRSKVLNSAPGKAKRGVASVAANAKCGVIPVAVINNEGLKKHSKYTVRYGKMIPYEEFGFSEEATREEQIEAADKIMEHITSLWEEGHCSE